MFCRFISTQVYEYTASQNVQSLIFLDARLEAACRFRLVVFLIIQLVLFGFALFSFENHLVLFGFAWFSLEINLVLLGFACFYLEVHLVLLGVALFSLEIHLV